MEKHNIHAISRDRDFIENADPQTAETGPDEVTEEAKGGELSDMPKGYYRSWRFIGSLLAVVFMAQGSYLGNLLHPPILITTR
jgi:hypothetical protein